MPEFVPDRKGAAIKVGRLHHVIGNDHCSSCEREFPMLCKCGGLIHRQYTPEIITQCDRCGPEYKL